MILLIGKTASGKDTILNEIVKMGYRKLVTYTTRPMRAGEIDGLNYHYISTEEFLLKEEQGFFAETTSYNVATGERWYYGSALEDFNRDSVMIVNPDGVKQISKIKSLNPVVFYIQADEDLLRARLFKRGDNAAEFERRLREDNKDFFGIERHVNYFICNNGLLSPFEVASEIVRKYRNERTRE